VFDDPQLHRPFLTTKGTPLLLVRPAPELEPPAQEVRRPLRLVPKPPSVHQPPTSRPARPLPDPVDPAALVGAQQVLRLALEVQDGRRSPQQLRHLLPPNLVDMVITLARRSVRGSFTPGRLQRVHVQQVTPLVAEAFATVVRGPRVHAVAARLELGAPGWRCTALRLG
jgi:hypothetical protein